MVIEKLEKQIVQIRRNPKRGFLILLVIVAIFALGAYFTGYLGEIGKRHAQPDLDADAEVDGDLIKSIGKMTTGSGVNVTKMEKGDNKYKRLFEDNIEEIMKMEISAGSMVRALLMAMEDPRNGPAYIKLSNAINNRVYYVYVEGNETLISRVGRSLGLIVTDSYIETNTRPVIKINRGKPPHSLIEPWAHGENTVEPLLPSPSKEVEHHD